MYIYLESVGCVLCQESKVVYPLLANGKIDRENGTPLIECSEEFFETILENEGEIFGVLI